MAKNVDYSKIKAMAQSILECIGDDCEGENPSIPKQTQDIDDGGQDKLESLAPAAKNGETGVGEEEKKRKKDASLAMMGTMLAAKFKK
jgi:hypothetical protein